MDISTPTVSPLRQRMLDDMRMRNAAEHTQDGYIRAVRKLAALLGCSPDTATIEELRRFQLHPQVVAIRRPVVLAGRVSHNPKQQVTVVTFQR